MSLLDTIKSFFSGGSAADASGEAGHDHAGHDHDHSHDHGGHTHEPAAAMPPADADAEDRLV
jgi:hypothetical protein